MVFKRNNVDFMAFSQATGKIFLQQNTEIQGDVNFVAGKTVQVDNVNTVGDNDMTFQRNGVEYLKFVGATSIVDVGTSIALSSNYLYCNYLRSRSILTNDMVFEGANTTGSGYTEFMRYRKGEEDVMISKDAYILQTNRLYLHKGSSVNSYITSTNIAGANHTNFINEDPNGELRFSTNGSIKMFIRATDMTLGAGVVFSGDFNDTSDRTKKYDIKDAEYDFTDMVKKIKPKTFKMKDEKEIGINKNHLGFIADEIKDVIPSEFENIVGVNQDNIKMLNYIKMNAILWGCVQEQQDKIEHLEASVYELQEAMKDLTKAKAKAKAKSKTEK
jgi:hypothetical protein